MLKRQSLRVERLCVEDPQTLSLGNAGALECPDEWCGPPPADMPIRAATRMRRVGGGGASYARVSCVGPLRS